MRASRELGDPRDLTVVGPIEYDIVEPLHKIRFVLEANDAQPVSFDYTLTG